MSSTWRVKQENRASMICAPIAVFAYNRPRHLQRCLDSLIRNSESAESQFWFFCDGPKTQKDEKLVSECIKIIDNFNVSYDSRILLSGNNKGLAPSIINGVGLVLAEHDSIIVVEDDLVASPYFLKFMNEGLIKFKSEELVASIHGFSYNFKKAEPTPYFIRGADCWGWATWSNRWKLFEPDSNKLIASIEHNKLIKDFNLSGAYPYFEMLKRQSRGEISSWAIRWHASMFLANRLTLYPNQTLINNDGADGSGTHAGQSKSFNSKLADRPIDFLNIEVRESKRARRKLKSYLRKHYSIRHKYSPLRIGYGLKRRLF